MIHETQSSSASCRKVQYHSISRCNTIFHTYVQKFHDDSLVYHMFQSSRDEMVLLCVRMGIGHAATCASERWQRQAAIQSVS